MRNIIFITFSLLLIITSCEKNNNSESDPDEPLNFKSLIAKNDTIEPGESTKIIATATGYLLSYKWSATAGDILGSGSEVIYTATPCSVGNNEIICIVHDGNNQSQTKTINVVVQ